MASSISPLSIESDVTSESDSLLLSIRFSASIPDLELDIDHPETTTTAGLKQLIRARLPPDLSSHRLRLIYAGRGLEDATSLSIGLKLALSPARTSPAPDNAHDERSAKGKERVRDTHIVTKGRPRLYIHCSIGDIVLSDVDLANEAAAAEALRRRRRLLPRGPNDDSHEGFNDDGNEEFSSRLHAPERGSDGQQLQFTTPAPRGFDRLLSAGFTPVEVAALRSQFLAIHAFSRTPDTMPSGQELRELEDRWIDEGSTAMTGGLGGGSGLSLGDDDGGFGMGSRGAVDDMLWGTVMGFFWPVGCAMWLTREEGLWSWRKGLAVFVGVVVNAFFGGMRMMS